MSPLEVPTIVDSATDRLRDLILSGEYRPATRLVERQIAADLLISTIAVREALARLEAEGLVDRISRRGAVVASITIAGIRDLSSVRIALEQLAVELAMPNWSTALSEKAQGIVDLMRVTKSTPGGRTRLRELDRRFHRLFMLAADSPTLESVLSQIDGRLALYLAYAARSLSDDEASRVADVHQEWLDAMMSGHQDLLHTVVRNHIMNSRDSIIAGFNQNSV